MGRYLVQRLIQSAITLFLIALAIFFLLRLSGDPLASILPSDAPDETIELVTRNMGFDKPLYFQFGIYLKDLSTANFGKSIRARRPVMDLMLERAIPTLQLALAAMIVALVIAFPTAAVSAILRGGKLDRTAQGIAFFGIAAPHFWLGLIMIHFIAVKAGLLPAAGLGGNDQVADFKHLIMPAFTLGAGAAAAMMRLLRSSMLEALDSEYVKFARIKGVPEWRVLSVHALRNSLIPLFTYSGLVLAGLITGGVTTEVVFNWPGLGRLAFEGIKGRDFPLVQGVVFAGAVLIVGMNLFVDIAYAYIDPRIRLAD